MTSLSQSNDHLEGTWMLKYWLGQFREPSINIQTRKKIAKLAVEQALEEYTALGMCFSEERDLLSQWRGYAQDGTGFSVSFQKKEIEKLVSVAPKHKSLRLSKISYGNSDLNKLNSISKSTYLAFGSEIDNSCIEENGTVKISRNLTPEHLNMQREAVQDFFTVKNGAFDEEKEWRLLLFDSLSKIVDAEFRESGNGLSPFVRLKFTPKAVNGVTLGPTNRAPATVIKSAMEKYGFKGKAVQLSRASYRIG